MEIAQTLPLLPGDPRLIDYIVCELKSQGIFDQLRKECNADVDTKPAYQNLRQRVEGTVDGFLSRQKWKPELNKNQLREKLRKHILDSNFLEQGVERIVDQVVNPKIASVFLPQVEEVVYKCLGLEKPDRSNKQDSASNSQPLHVDTDTLLPNDLEAVSPDSDKSHEKSFENPLILSESNDTEMKLIENKEEVDVKIDKSVPSVESYDDSDDSKDDDFESPAFEPIDDLKRDSPSISQHSVVSDVNSRDSNDWRTSAVISKAALKSVHSQESSDSTDEKSFNKTPHAITYDSCEDANMASPVKMNIEGNQTNFKLTNEDNSSDARQCFEPTKPKQDEKMDFDDSEEDTYSKSEQKQDPAKSSTGSEVGEPIKHHRSSVESKASSESNKPTPCMDVSMDSNDSSSIFTPTQKDSYAVKDTFTFANKIAALSDKSLDDTSNSNELKIDLQESAESEDNIKNINQLSISGSENLKSPSIEPTNTNPKDESRRKTDRSDSYKSTKDSERRSSSSHHSKDRKEDSKHHSRSSHSKYSNRHDDRRHSSSHDRKDSHKSSKDSHSSDRGGDSKRDRYHKPSNGDRDKDSKDRHGSSSHRSSSSSQKHSSHKSSSSSKHEHRHSTSEKSSFDKYDRPSLSRHESKESHKNDKNKDLPHSSRESSGDKTSSRHGDKTSDHSNQDKSRHSQSSHKDRSRGGSRHSTSSSDRHRKSSTGEKKQDDKKGKEKSDKDEYCSSFKSGRTRRSTDRDSNDGNEGTTRHGSSNTNMSTHQSSTKEKSSQHSKSSHSNGNSSSGQSDSAVASDKVKVSAGGYIKSEFNMFQPVVKKSPTTPQLHRSPEVAVPAPTTAKKPVIHIDSQLNPVKSEVSPELTPASPNIEKIRKPKIASNIYEARKLMKIRKNMDMLERKQNENARKEEEKSKNVPKGESKVYSGSSGPELQITCRKRSISNPKSPKDNGDDTEKESLHYFDEPSKNKVVGFEKSKKHLKQLLATHNGISQKVECVVFLVNSDKTVVDAFNHQSSKGTIIRTVSFKRSGIVNKHKGSPLKLDIPTDSEVSLPSSSNCYVELNDLKYDDAYCSFVKSKCLPLKKRKMSESKLIHSAHVNKPNSTVETKPITSYEKTVTLKYDDYNTYNEEYEYLDYYSQVDDVLSKATKQDIMEIILGGGVSFHSSLVDLNHVKKENESITNEETSIENKEGSSPNGKTLQNKKRRISFKGSDDIIEPGIIYNNNLKEQNECPPAKKRKISTEKNGEGGNTNRKPNNNSILRHSAWSSKARRDYKPLKGIIRNKTLPTQESPQSPESDKSVENHLDSEDDNFNQKPSKDFKENSEDISSTALNQINHQNKNRNRSYKTKTVPNKCATENVLESNIVATEKA